MVENLIDVLIVGAGAAGLTAAYDLHHETDYTFKILEANSGIGGRLQKLEGFADFPIDLGGEWIHVNPTILDEIADHSITKPTNEIGTVQYVDTYEGWTGNSWDTLDYGGTDYKFVNYTWADFFSDKVASDVASDIVLDCQVSSIDWTNSPVEVACEDGRQWTAKHVIVTASMKVLQDNDIDFTPQLPTTTQNAVNEFTFLSGMKIFLRFKDSFQFKEAFQFNSDVSGSQTPFSERFFYDITYGQQSQDNVMAIFAVGDPVEKFLTMTDDEIYADVLAQLDGVYNGQATPNILEGFVQNWNDEVFVKGAYTSLTDDWDALGAIPSLRESLDDRIFFAGEGVPIDWDYGYAHGAALSGRSAATRIKALLDVGSNNDDAILDDDGGQNDDGNDDSGNDDGDWDDDWEGDDDWFSWWWWSK